MSRSSYKAGTIIINNNSATYNNLYNFWEMQFEDTNSNFHVYAINRAASSVAGGVWHPLDNSNFWRSSSDVRLKRDIYPLASVIEKILQLNPVTFNLKTQPLDSLPAGGFIAQEVESIFPSLVSETILPNYDFNVKGISITGFIPFIVKMIQEQQNMDTKQTQIQELRLKLEDIKERHRMKTELLRSEINHLKSITQK